jgi:hypothetical protein
MDEVVVDTILDIGAPGGRAVDPGVIGFILGEQQGDRALAVEVIVLQGLQEQRVRMVRVDDAAFRSFDRVKLRALHLENVALPRRHIQVEPS